MVNVCASHLCVKCCSGTEMALLEEDLCKVERLGFERARFSLEHKGLIVLRNYRHRCVFHDGERCTIYSSRPAGCRLYPIAFDEGLGHAVLDALCPFSAEFALTPAARRESLLLYEGLIREARIRKKKRKKI